MMCAKAGMTAILGAGFDPGVVNAFARFAVDEFMDKVTSIDIVDINAGTHGKYFATNFDPEINFREFTGTVYSWQSGAWQENKMFEVGREWDLPVVGKQQGLSCPAMMRCIRCPPTTRTPMCGSGWALANITSTSSPCCKTLGCCPNSR